MLSLKSERLFVLGLAAALLVCACEEEVKKVAPPVVEAPVEVAGTVVGVTSKDGRPEAVRIETAEGKRPATSGAPIHSSEQLVVAADGAAMLTLKGGGRLSLNAGTVVKVLSPTALEIGAGEIWLENGIADRAEPLSVKTKHAGVTLTGAAAGIRVDETSEVVSVVTGSAGLEGVFGRRVVGAGQEIVVDAQGARRVHLQDPSGLVSWTKALRDALAPAGAPKEAAGMDAPSGLGTLIAKMPGGGAPLPFLILAEEVRVRIQDHVALTRVEQVFKNPTSQVVEATYKFPLPPGAKLNRFDMEIKGRMMQGEIVERQKGRKILKTVIRQFVDRMRDPALVEWESGSTFKTRIFPIQPKEEKRIVLTYLETLKGAGGRYRYVLPVSPAGGEAPRIPLFRLRAEVGGSGGAPRIASPLYPAEIRQDGERATLEFTANDFEPEVDFTVQINQPARPEALLATYGKADQKAVAGGAPGIGAPYRLEDDYFMLTLAPSLPETDAAPPSGGDWCLLVDTSKSRSAVDVEIQKRLVDALIGIMGPDDRVKLIAFDMFHRLMDPQWAVPSEAFRKRAREFLDGIPPDGATHLSGALRAAAAQLDPQRPARIIVIGDGAATLGENRPGPLSDLAARLLDERASVSTIGVGSSTDTLLFEALTRKTGGKHFDLSSGEDLMAAAVRIIAGLRAVVLRRPALAFEGLQVLDVFPEALQNLASGEEVVITGRYRGEGRLTAKLTGALNGKPFERDFTFNIQEAKSANSFIPLLWASRQLDHLTLEDDEASIRQIVSLSKRFSIPSRYTSFIVLENAAMHREFNVAQTNERIEWTGEEEVEYEGSGEAVAGALDGIGSGGRGGMGGVGRIASGAGGMGAVMGAPMSAPKRSKSEAPRSKRKASIARGPADDTFGEPMPIARPPCRDRFAYDVRVWGVPDKARDRDRAEAVRLRQMVRQDPLSRKSRRELVRHLLRFGEYRDAAAEAAAWLEMDRANPNAVTYAADAVRFSGRLVDALRMYSGILDIQPEAKGVKRMLAAYFESKGQWREAYPFRVSLSLEKPKDHRRAAERAVAAQRAGYLEEALAAAGGLTAGDASLARGVRLSKDLKGAVLGIAAEGRLPLLFEAPSAEKIKNAKVRIAARWNTSQDLDLWVSKRGEKYLGGSDSKARLISGTSGTEGETLYMPIADPGKYKIQVVCAERGGCDTVAGTLEIRAHGTRRTIPFTLEGGIGTDVAILYVERWRASCYY